MRDTGPRTGSRVGTLVLILLLVVTIFLLYEVLGGRGGIESLYRQLTSGQLPSFSGITGSVSEMGRGIGDAFSSMFR